MVRRMLLAAAALALFALPVGAQSDPAAEEAIKKSEAQWAAAMVRGDWAAIDKMIGPGYIGTDGAGKRYTKTEYMAMLKTGGTTFSEYQPGAEQVIVSGNTAVHMGEGTMTVKMGDGAPAKVHVVWTDTWVKGKNGKWLCVAGQWVEHPVS